MVARLGEEAHDDARDVGDDDREQWEHDVHHVPVVEADVGDHDVHDRDRDMTRDENSNGSRNTANATASVTSTTQSTVSVLPTGARMTT